jgi:hypothetical protein
VWILEFPISARSYERIGTDKTACVYRSREVAIATPTLVTAQRMQLVIADFDAGPKSCCRK